MVVGLAFLARREPPLSTIIQLGLGMLCYQFAIGVMNDIADRDDDATAKPWKPIAAGVLRVGMAKAIAVTLIGAGLLVTLPLPTGAWLIGVGGLACGLAYDLWLKRTALSWAPMALAFPLIPAWVYVALDRWEALLWWVFPVGLTLGIAVHLANQLPDIAADASAGARGLAVRAGARRTASLAFLAYGAAMSTATAVLIAVEPGRALLVAATGAIGGLVGVRAVRLFGRDGLFGVFAVTSAGAALVFLSVA